MDFYIIARALKVIISFANFLIKSDFVIDIKQVCCDWVLPPRAFLLGKASSLFTAKLSSLLSLTIHESGEQLKIDLILPLPLLKKQKRPYSRCYHKISNVEGLTFAVALSLYKKYENVKKESTSPVLGCRASDNCVIFSLPHSLTSFCGTQWRQRCSWMLFTCWVLGHLTTTFQLEIDMYKIDFIRL